MKAIVLGLLAVVWGVCSFHQKTVDETFFFAGDFKGKLTPCGCTKPMSGGLRRMATAIALFPGAKLLVNGELLAGSGRQDEMKLESCAEAFRAMGLVAWNLAANDSQRGAGIVLSAHRLSGSRLISSSLERSDTVEIGSNVVSGKFLIGGITSKQEKLAGNIAAQEISQDEAVKRLLSEAQTSGLIPILLLDGSEATARQLALSYPKLKLIQYSSQETPPKVAQKVGSTLLISPGEYGKHVIRLKFDGQKFTGYVALDLGPEYVDNVKVSEVYSRYLDRLSGEKLLDNLPRASEASFLGSAKCGSCHSTAYKIWKNSDHAKALHTLEELQQDKDPDCVGCHVLGLDSINGFKSRRLTPQFSFVGCESCHGSGVEHSQQPEQTKMPKVTETKCLSCHTTTTSPGFEFNAHWKRIAH